MSLRLIKGGLDNTSGLLGDDLAEFLDGGLVCLIQSPYSTLSLLYRDAFLKTCLISRNFS